MIPIPDWKGGGIDINLFSKKVDDDANDVPLSTPFQYVHVKENISPDTKVTAENVMQSHQNAE